MMRNGAIRIAAALAVGLVCAQISGARAQAPALVELKLYGSIVEDIAPVLYAQQSGLFRRNGLDVTLDPATSGAAVVAAVVSGAYPIGKSSVISGLRAVAKGIPLVAIAPGWVFESKIRSAEMIVAADSPIKTGKDLNGKLIAVASLNELNQIAASAWVDKTGGDFTTLHFRIADRS